MGYSVRDRFQLGSVQIQSQPFIIVEDAALPRRKWDGICGLGWKALSKVGPTLYENMQQQSLPARFSIVPTSTAARLVLGDMPSNTSMKPNTLKWVPAEKYDPSGGFMADRTFWVVSGGVQINAPQPVPARFLVDTGTNQVLMVPTRFYQTFIRSLIPSSLFDSLCGHDPRAGVICECAIMREELKPLRIHLGGHPFVLPVSKMFMKVPAKMGGSMCMLTIQPNTMTRGGSMGGMGSLGGILGSILGGIAGPTVRTGRRLQETLGQLLGDMLADQQAHQDGSQVPLSQEPSSGQAPSITVIGMPPSGQPPALGGGHPVLIQPPSGQSPGFGGGHPVLIQPPSGQSPSLGGGHPVLIQPPPYGSEQPQFGHPPEQTGPLQGLQPEETIPYGAPHSGQVPPVPGGGQTPTAHAPVADPNELWMIGGVFLEHFVTIFDFDNAQLGFAEPTSRSSTDSLSGLWASKGTVVAESQSSWLVDALASAAFGGFVLGSLLGFRSFRLQRARPDRFLRASAEDVEQAID